MGTRPDKSKWDAVGYLSVRDEVLVIFECRCCHDRKDFGITREEWLSDPEAEEPAPKTELM